MSESALQHPSIVRAREIAEALGHLRARAVFIGGAIAPLLHTASTVRSPRPTKDVDAIAVTASYSAFYQMTDDLRTLGFRQEPDPKHVHRWRSPGGSLFDFVPAGEHLGGTGQEWDAVAIETSVEFAFPDGLTIRHASAPAFLALKFAAYHDRGMDDPFNSHDLEDVFALLVSRPTLLDEITASPQRLLVYVSEWATQLLGLPELEDLLAGHLNNAFDRVTTHNLALTRLRELASIGA